MKNFKALIMPVGGTGAGKTAWLKARLPERAIVELDEYREKMTDDPQDQSADQSAVSVRAIIARERMSRGLVFAADATNARPEHRHPLLETARRFAVPVIAVCFHVGIDECLRRMAIRGREVDRLVAEAILRDVNDPGNIANLAATTHLRIDVAENGAMAIRVSALGAPWPERHALIDYAQELAFNGDRWHFQPLEVTYDDPALEFADRSADEPADQPDPSGAPA